MTSLTMMISAEIFTSSSTRRKLPADCARASPPPGVSSTLTAVCMLGCILAVLLLVRGEQLLGHLLR